MRRGPLLARVLGVLLLTLLGACAQRWPAGLDVDDSITAVSQSSRVRFIVLHFTHSAREKALATLSRGRVSAHYLITDTDPVKVYALVPESRSAWHAGVSSWRGHTYVNNASIGIEIVNDGERPYTEAQIRAVILLVQDLATPRCETREYYRAQRRCAPTQDRPRRALSLGTFGGAWLGPLVRSGGGACTHHPVLAGGRAGRRMVSRATRAGRL